MAEELRQGGDTETGVSQIEITPEMLKAGLAVFRDWPFPSIALDDLGLEYPAALRASLECAVRQQAEKRTSRG